MDKILTPGEAVRQQDTARDLDCRAESNDQFQDELGSIALPVDRNLRAHQPPYVREETGVLPYQEP